MTFSHYCETLDLDDDEKRSFYEREAANAGWSVRELRRQMESMLFERVPVGSEKDFVDMVFYNKPLRAYVLIELKTTKLMASAVGQINEYLNYYAAEVKKADQLSLRVHVLLSPPP